MDKKELEDYKKAGEIAIKVKEFAKELIKPDMLLVNIAKKIHEEIEKHNAVPAFPVNLSIDDIAAHYHPTLEDETKASGLLKIPFNALLNLDLLNIYRLTQRCMQLLLYSKKFSNIYGRPRWTNSCRNCKRCYRINRLFQ